MPDRGRGRFHRIACADALPMPGGDVEECHEFGPVLFQAQQRWPWFFDQFATLLRWISAYLTALASGVLPEILFS
jgi:hypothetical protein